MPLGISRGRLGGKTSRRTRRSSPSCASRRGVAPSAASCCSPPVARGCCRRRSSERLVAVALKRAGDFTPAPGEQTRDAAAAACGGGARPQAGVGVVAGALGWATGSASAGAPRSSCAWRRGPGSGPRGPWTLRGGARPCSGSARCRASALAARDPSSLARWRCRGRCGRPIWALRAHGAAPRRRGGWGPDL